MEERRRGLKTIAEIRQQLLLGKFEFTRHAFKRAIERNISELEIIEAGANSLIVEDYPTDKYSPSCLLLGITIANRVLHLQVSRMESDLVKIITLYEPDDDEWTDNYTTRRS
jgi:methanogenic corrinoid protein MtbC1